eukprot:TRINITY_DN12547_c0_g1_i1.p1 TRINITY_DN12547_c0_g1~~TRINITY_DN12547_c0_g1_i1.p1  ORF type:complete len:297 (-),score=38.59 TRINITY_DN12547_c0_g1_i1:5-895(-)
MVEFLLQHPKIGARAIMVGMIQAARFGRLEVGERLLQIPGLLDHSSFQLHTAFTTAASSGHFPFFHRLFQLPRIRSTPTTLHDALISASSSNQLPVVRFLLETVPDIPFEPHYKAFLAAVQHGCVPVVQFFLRHPTTQLARHHQAALMSAVSEGHLSVLNLLLADPKVEAWARDFEALTIALKNGQIEIVRRLLEVPEIEAAYQRETGPQANDYTAIALMMEWNAADMEQELIHAFEMAECLQREQRLPLCVLELTMEYMWSGPVTRQTMAIVRKLRSLLRQLEQVKNKKAQIQKE